MNIEIRSPEHDLLISSLDSAWSEFGRQLSLSREACTEDAVHYLRVALRRLLTLCDLINAVTPGKAVIGLQKEFLDLRDRFDELRDTQVMILRVGEILTSFPEARFFIEYLQRREHKSLIVMEKYLAGSLSENLLDQVNQLRTKLDAVSKEPQKGKKGLLKFVDSAYLTVLKKRKKVDPGDPASIHPLRIAFRNFRYQLEVIHPLLPGFPVENLGELKKYQDAMGEIQNDEVLIQALERYAGRKHHINQDRVMKYFNDHHLQAVQSFFENNTNIEKFWRVPGKTDFPWVGKTDFSPALSS